MTTSLNPTTPPPATAPSPLPMLPPTRADYLARLKAVEANIAEVRHICGWPDHEANRPRFHYGEKRFKLANSNTFFYYTEAEIRPFELDARFMLEIAHDFQDNLKRLHFLVEQALDAVLLNVADAHLDLGRGKLYTFLLAPNDSSAYPDLHWLAQYELAGEWDPLTCVYLKNSEVLTVSLAELALKIADHFNRVMMDNLEP